MHHRWTAVFSVGGVWLIAAFLASPAFAGDKNIFDDDWTPPKAKETPPAPPVPAPPVASKPPAVKPGVPAPAQPPPVIQPTATAKAPAVAAASRKPIPEKAAQDQSRKLMRDLYAKQLSDHSAAGRRKLAQELLKESDKVRDNPVDQYVLLAGAIEAAKEGGSLHDTVRAGNAMATTFSVDGLALKTESALKLAISAADSASTAQNVTAGLDLLDQLAQQEDFTSAARLCTTLQNLPGLSAHHRQVLQQRSRELALMKTTQERFGPAAEKLKTAPDDPAANLAVGQYLSFCRGDWTGGLPFLAKSPEGPLQAAATADMANPQTPEARAAVGDAWYTVGEKDTAWQTPTRQRAAAWYQDAMAQGKLTGLNRLRVEKRIAEMGIRPAAAQMGGPAQRATLSLIFKGSLQVYLNQTRVYDGDGGTRSIPLEVRPGDRIFLRLKSPFVFRSVRFALLNAEKEVILDSRPENVVVQTVPQPDAAPKVDPAATIKPAGGRPDKVQDGLWTSAKFPAVGQWIGMPEKNVNYDVIIEVPAKLTK